LLVTGDIERRAEAGLGADAIAAEVVIVPHHGSATPSSAAFVAAVGPRVAIVSAGHENRWGFPRPEVRARWESVGADIVVTGQSGAVHASLGGDVLEVAIERASRRRYWRSETTDLPGDSAYGAL
jgi:competence protein ComEC